MLPVVSLLTHLLSILWGFFKKGSLLAGLVIAPAHDMSGSESVSGGEVGEQIGEKEKNTPPVDSVGGDSQLGADSSLEAMSVSTSMSMPSLEEVSHNSTAAGLLTLQDPALTRLVAEAFRLAVS